jgi:hypothetical protein
MKILKIFSNKCLSLSYLGENWNNNLMQSIIEAGRTISYVETLNPSKADKFNLAIKESNEKLFRKEFEKVVRFAIAEMKLKKVKIAFDTTEDKTWMKDNYNLRPSSYEKHMPTWQYINVSIVEPYFIPLMSLPYRQIDNLDLLVIELLKYVKKLPIIVDLILFDRGFYHARLIDYMNGKNKNDAWNYLILVPENKKVKKYIEQTKRFKYFKHKFSYSKDKSKWKPSTTIIIHRIDKEICWCYATNQKPSILLRIEYKKRWNIETGFRIHDEVRIKSKSRDSRIRLFYHLVGMLLIILWRLQNRIKYYVFKRYLKYVEYQFYHKKIKELLDPP